MPKSVKMGCPFRRENILLSDPVTFGAYRNTQKVPKGAQGAQNDEKTSKMVPQGVPNLKKNKKAKTKTP